jgi:hypothetical protein
LSSGALPGPSSVSLERKKIIIKLRRLREQTDLPWTG